MNLAAFSSYIFLTAFTPGPNNIMSMNLAGKLGLRQSFRFCFGVLLGFAIDMTLCAVFAAMLYRYIPAVEPVMRWLGAAYILLLAGFILRDKPHGEKKSRLRPDSVLTGMVLQFVNVKVILYGITALSTFVLPHHQSAPALIMAVLVLVAVGFAANCSWALFGSVFQRLFATHRRLLNWVMALALVYCAVVSVIG